MSEFRIPNLKPKLSTAALVRTVPTGCPLRRGAVTVPQYSRVQCYMVQHSPSSTASGGSIQLSAISRD
jgi:hypothetical protein